MGLRMGWGSVRDGARHGMGRGRVGGEIGMVWYGMVWYGIKWDEMPSSGQEGKGKGKGEKWGKRGKGTKKGEGGKGEREGRRYYMEFAKPER